MGIVNLREHFHPSSACSADHVETGLTETVGVAAPGKWASLVLCTALGVHCAGAQLRHTRGIRVLSLLSLGFCAGGGPFSLVFLYFLGFLPSTPRTTKDPCVSPATGYVSCSPACRCLTQHISPGTWGFLGFPLLCRPFCGGVVWGWYPPFPGFCPPLGRA